MTVRLRHVAAVNPSTPEFEVLPDTAELPFLPLEAIWPGDRLDTTRRQPKADVSSGYTRFREGDILLPKITPTFQADRTVIANGLEGGVGAGTTELHVVRAGPDADARYLRYLLSSKKFLDEGEASMIGVAGQKRVPDEYLRDLAVPVVNPLHQRTIADYLDRETTRIDVLIEKDQLMVGLLGEHQARQLSAVLFARDAHGTFVEDQILGPVPAIWRCMRLRHCVQITVGVVVNPSSYFAERGVPFIHGSDVRDGWIDTHSFKYLSTESNDNLWKSRLRQGDVVVVRAGYPGRAAVVPPELDGSNCASILILRKGSLLRPSYLAHFLNSLEGRTQVALAQYGAAQEQINVSDIVDFIAPVPPLDVQDQILSKADAMLEQHQRTAAMLNHQIDLLREHRQALITAAVTGELEIPEVAA